MQVACCYILSFTLFFTFWNYINRHYRSICTLLCWSSSVLTFSKWILLFTLLTFLSGIYSLLLVLLCLMTLFIHPSFIRSKSSYNILQHYWCNTFKTPIKTLTFMRYLFMLFFIFSFLLFVLSETLCLFITDLCNFVCRLSLGACICVPLHIE